MFFLPQINQGMQFDFELVVHRGENQVDGVEQGLPSYCDVERDVRLCRLRTCMQGMRLRNNDNLDDRNS